MLLHNKSDPIVNPRLFIYYTYKRIVESILPNVFTDEEVYLEVQTDLESAIEQLLKDKETIIESKYYYKDFKIDSSLHARILTHNGFKYLRTPLTFLIK